MHTAEPRCKYIVAPAESGEKGLLSRDGVHSRQAGGLGEAYGLGQSPGALHWHAPGAAAARADTLPRAARALGTALGQRAQGSADVPCGEALILCLPCYLAG